VTSAASVPEARDTALAALRWVARAAVPADGGVSWPDADRPGQLTDELHTGTAGVLIAFTEARLAGVGEFDELAVAAAGRIRTIAATATRSAADDRLDAGSAGIAAWLLRLSRVADVAQARRIAWPDRPWL
jgi:hypothetical protein